MFDINVDLHQWYRDFPGGAITGTRSETSAIRDRFVINSEIMANQ